MARTLSRGPVQAAKAKLDLIEKRKQEGWQLSRLARRGADGVYETTSGLPCVRGICFGRLTPPHTIAQAVLLAQFGNSASALFRRLILFSPKKTSP